MIEHRITSKTSFKINNSVEGETIEAKMRRVVNNGEPITDGAPIIYQPRKEGVRPEFNIRTDRFEIALDATDKIAKSKVAKRVDFQTKKDELLSGDKSIQGTKNE